MPMPALLYVLGFFTLYPTIYSIKGWPAPQRFSSTAKGELPRPGVFYFMEDTVAVNANAGRPYREAINARYEASPRFRRMVYVQSLFWSIPAIIIAIPLTIIACIHAVPATVAYAICKSLRKKSVNILNANEYRLGCSLHLGDYLGTNLYVLVQA